MWVRGNRRVGTPVDAAVAGSRHKSCVMLMVRFVAAPSAVIAVAVVTANDSDSDDSGSWLWCDNNN